MGKRGRPRPPTAETLELERQVLELRRAGVTFDAISTQLETPRSTCVSAYKRSLSRTLLEPAHDIRALEVDRLDRMQAALWARAMRGELPAMDRLLRVMERRADLLGLDHRHGLDERRVELAEGQAEMVMAGLLAVLELLGPPPEVQERAVQVFLGKLGRGEVVVGELEEAPS